MKTIPWNVFVIEYNGSLTCTKLIDTVFYNKDCDAQYVYVSLINHDGYPSNIIVRNDIIHQELYYGRSIEDYAYDIEQDIDYINSMYVYPVDNGL